MYSSTTAIGIGDEMAVAGGDRPQAGPDVRQPFERGEVRRHVAVGWADDHRRPLHDVVTGEQGPLLVEQEAQVVRGVARGVQGREVELGGLDDRLVTERAVEPDLALALAAVERQDLGPGPLLEAHGAGRVVLVGVRQQDPADAVAAAARDRVEVLGIARAGVDHCDLVDAHEVRVGPRTRHDPRVAGDDPPHHRGQGAGHAVDDGPGDVDGRLSVASSVICGPLQLAARCSVEPQLAARARILPALDVPDVVGGRTLPPGPRVPITVTRVRPRLASDRTTTGRMTARGGGNRSSKATTSLMKPGAIISAPAIRISAPSATSRLGMSPRPRASWIRRSVMRPSRLANQAPTSDNRDEQSDGVEHADRAGDLDDHRQLDEGSHEEEENEENHVPRVVRVCGIELKSGGHTSVGGRPHVRLSLPPGRCPASGASAQAGPVM